MKRIEVDSYDEFLDMVKAENFDLSETIVNTILDNYKTYLENPSEVKRHIPAFEIDAADEKDLLYLSVDMEDALDALEKNLRFFEKYEDYEGCGNIVEAISFIKQHKNS